VDAGAFSPHAPGSREYLAMESGKLLLTIDGVEYELDAGDSIFYAGDCVHAYRNPSSRACVYYLAMDVSPNWITFHAAGRKHSGREKRGHGAH
jgi:XRE family transcriptional regulator, regulator of sulfur utilization